MIKPIFTEKSTQLAKQGKYTFLVGLRDGKPNLKSQISKLFKVHVRQIRTLKTGGIKKAIVVLKDGEKIDVFHEKPKKNTK